MVAQPHLDVGRVRSPDRRGPAGQIGEAEATTSLRRDTYVVAVEMTDDHYALGFAWAGTSYMNPISAILGPARTVVDAAAATIVDDVDRLGLRRPRVNAASAAASAAVTMPFLIA